MLLFTECKKDETDLAKFIVTLDSKGGSAVVAAQVEQGQKLTKPTNPTNGDFIFVGWFKEAKWVTVWNFDTDMVTKDITLYAKWTTVTKTITFNTDGGSAVAPLTVAKGSTAVKPLPPIKKDFAFDNWYTEPSKTNVYDFNTAVNTNITLYAKWISVTREALEALLYEAYRLSSTEYTFESYKAMQVNREVADLVLQLEDPSTQQIENAYTGLSVAISALVALPYREAVGINISRVIDGVMFVVPGQYFDLQARAADARGRIATNSRVTFTYDASKLAELAEGDIKDYNSDLSFQAKDELVSGATMSVIAKSAENPAISKTVILKAVREGELEVMFINAVNALPALDKISYEHYDAINYANEIYYYLPNTQDATVKIAYEKFRQCNDAYSDLPMRAQYSFKGNECTLTYLDGAREELKLTFIAAGSFPVGTYTENSWNYMSNVEYGYVQWRSILNSDGSGVDEFRLAKDANGTDPQPWTKDLTFTYTNKGTQVAGGMFFMVFKSAESAAPNDEAGVESVRSPKAGAPWRSISKRLQ